MTKWYNKAPKYRFRFIWYLVLLTITIGIAIALQVIVFYPETSQTEPEATNIINRCYVYSPHIPYYPDVYVYGSLMGHEWLINCLIMEESGGDETAINPMDVDGRPKFGLLQYDSRTFETYCVRKYGLPDDIFNGEIQKICCSKMISNGLARHWGTLYDCL